MKCFLNKCFFNLEIKHSDKLLGFRWGQSQRRCLQMDKGNKRLTNEELEDLQIHFRFINDLIALNDDNEFDKKKKGNLCPRTGLSQREWFKTWTSFLDLRIEIGDNTFNT